MLKKVFLIFVIICWGLKSEAQLYKLLNLTEQEVRKEITNYPIVERQYSEHEFGVTLFFKNNAKEIKLICIFHFNANKCGTVKSFQPLRKLKRIKRKFDKQFTVISNNRWRSKDNTFEVFVHTVEDKMSITYSRGISRF